MARVFNRQISAPLLAIAFLLRSVSAMPLTALEAVILAADGKEATLKTRLAPSWSTTSPIGSTADILWTSVVTLPICVYTVIHVNIPPPGEKRRELYRRKALWVVAAILVPEYALWTAFEQWDAAKRLRIELQEWAQKRNLEFRFGLTYCFYAAMGGFIVDVSPIHDTLRYMTITPAGLVFLAKHGHFIKHSKESIQDKSKAGILAKVLVCLQVVWLVIQSIGRAVNGLPVALLEIHVLAVIRVMV
ncbi:hypothetical protein F5B18DRAFT_655854 [Nemania serpens]|nr:hypothetical protein F5B18DRAFT_655854 [Nemania serpens]